MSKRNAGPSLREQREAAARVSALAAVRTQAFNWALAAGFQCAVDRWSQLDALSVWTNRELTKMPDGAEKDTLRLIQETRNATMTGIEDAAKRNGWMAE